MAHMRFDLEDGKPPVCFNLNPDDTERFAEFMEGCTKALHIADEAMFELLLSECVHGDEFGLILSLTDGNGNEVNSLVESSQAINDAVEWLQPRGYISVVEDMYGESILVLLSILES